MTTKPTSTTVKPVTTAATTSAASSSAVPSASSAAPPATTDTSGACSSAYAQCGGKAFIGASCCECPVSLLSPLKRHTLVDFGLHRRYRIHLRGEERVLQPMRPVIELTLTSRASSSRNFLRLLLNYSPRSSPNRNLSRHSRLRLRLRLRLKLRRIAPDFHWRSRRPRSSSSRCRRSWIHV